MSNSETVLNVCVPGLGESVTEARIAKWLKAEGQVVSPDDVIAELETDKATVELPAAARGVLHIVQGEGRTVNVGDLIARIETGAAAPAPAAVGSGETAVAASPRGRGTPAAAGEEPPTPTTVPVEPNRPPLRGEPGAATNAPRKDSSFGTAAAPAPGESTRPLSPAVRRLVAENHLNPDEIVATGPGQRLTKGDVLEHLARRESTPLDAAPTPADSLGADRSTAPAAAVEAEETRVEISMLRQTIARRLVEAQRTAAILTTINEIDMSAVMALREKYREQFEKAHQVGLGFLSFFARAACAALKAVPVVNAQLQDRAIVYKHHVHLALAVATDKGLIVPVIRYADKLSMAQIEVQVKQLAARAREGKITLEELGGGTFTITNGGVFGSLLSTPILNPPQSAILGLHKIQKRPVVVAEQIVVRPMMYVALSYDHRLIDGREAVTFLVHIKEALEDPARLLLEV